MANIICKLLKIHPGHTNVAVIVNGRAWHGQWLCAWGKIMPYIRGKGIDCGPGLTPIPGSIPVEPNEGFAQGYKDLVVLPMERLKEAFEANSLDFVFSSHALEHAIDWRLGLRNMVDILRVGGNLILYIPHPCKDSWRADGHRKDHKYNFSFDKIYDLIKQDVDLLYGTNRQDGFGSLLFIARKVARGTLQWAKESEMEADLTILREFKETIK